MFPIPWLERKLRDNICHSGTKRQIDNGCLAASQTQHFPDEVCDILDVHLLDDPARLYLVIESVVDEFELVS
jgi:hypothetical protein